jgi:hypothetical protein
MRLCSLFLGGACLLALPAWGQQRPLKTDDADLVGTGRIRTEAGMEFLQNQRYSISGLDGDLARLGVASIHLGVGEYAEFQISGVFQDFLSVSKRNSPAIAPSFSGNTTNDFGDLVLASKFRFTPEKGLRPAIGFKFAVELPNAKHDSGLGNDETEFYSSLLVSKHYRSVWLLANVGLSILPSPILRGRQADMTTYGFGMIVPAGRRINLVAEINGRRGPVRQGNEAQSLVRAGAQIWTGPIRWDIAGIAGLKPYDADSGVTVGMTYEFPAFHKRQKQDSPRLPELPPPGLGRHERAWPAPQL